MSKDFIPIKDSRLTLDKLSLKKLWDDEWKADSDQRAAVFYARKRRGQTTPEEEQVFLAEDAARWAGEEHRRIEAGMYERVDKARLEIKRALLQAETAEVDARIKAME